jgi:hypothetical protein
VGKDERSALDTVTREAIGDISLDVRTFVAPQPIAIESK